MQSRIAGSIRLRAYECLSEDWSPKPFQFRLSAAALFFCIVDKRTCFRRIS